MELALVDHYQGCRADLTHVVRETNQWADDLTHATHTGFDPEKEFVPDQTTRHILHKLVEIHNSNKKDNLRDVPY